MLLSQYIETNAMMKYVFEKKEKGNASKYANGIFVNKSFHGLNGDNQKPKKNQY